MPPGRLCLAHVGIAPVASASGGPPLGGLFLKPPSLGGLCDGVTTMPSDRSPAREEEVLPEPRPRLNERMAWLTAGVGVYRSAASIIATTSLAASTSSAEAHAGSDNAWVSRPMNSGPVVPCEARYSTIAWVVARMWASLNAASRLEPRCPDVPKTTC